MSWSLTDGVELVRAIQPVCRDYGYHLTLGGSVLNKGESDRDIDLYFLPLENPDLPKADPEKLQTWLTEVWGKPDTANLPYESAGGLERPANEAAAPARRRIGVPVPAPRARVMEVGADVNGNMMYQWIVDDGRLNEVAPFVPPPVNPDSSYKSRLRFVRKHDKIDVYIIGRG